MKIYSLSRRKQVIRLISIVGTEITLKWNIHYFSFFLPKKYYLSRKGTEKLDTNKEDIKLTHWLEFSYFLVSRAQLEAVQKKSLLLKKFLQKNIKLHTPSRWKV